MDRIKGTLLALVALLLSVCACLALYRFDNKYTAPGVQPISGVLFLSEEELENSPVHYLTREWEFYPGVSLTPAELPGFTGYRRFVDIGGPGNLDRGKATYRLTLQLPETERLYALELPEVYDSCRLYVNGVLLLQLGGPDGGTGRTSTRPVCFNASGQAELLLAVSNQWGIYGGLTYPPSFGEARAVLAHREARLLLHTALALLALLGSALAVCFGRQWGWRPRLLGGLLYLCLFGIAGYPLLHALLTTPLWPWYLMEAGCYYGLLLLALLLECEWYGVKGKYTLLLAAPCALGLIGTIVTFSGVPFSGFPVISTIVKYYAAACLLGLSFWALRKKRTHSPLLLCAGVTLTATLIFDRIFPLYEPIYGCWFGEIGGIVLGTALIIAFWLEAAAAYRFRLTYQTERQALRQRLILQKEHYKQLTGEIEKSKEASHDLRHHLRLVRSLIEQGESDRLLVYLEEYEPHLKEREVTTFSDHLVADAILKYYAAEAKQLGAVYDVRLAVPPDLSFPDDELCILLSNLLENSVESLSQQEKGEKLLYLRGDSLDGRLGLIVRNSFDGQINPHNQRHMSTKHEGLGLGVASVRTIAEKYGGLADFAAEGGIFQVSVWIPLLQRASKKDPK